MTLQIAGESKKELYKGHGVVTGTLRRDIQTSPARIDGARVTGVVGTSQITRHYALPIHRRYEYLVKGLERVRPKARSILERHIKRATRGPR